VPQNKEVHREYMRKYRQGSQDSVTGSRGVTIDREEAVELLKIYSSLDKTISTLTGSANMLALVRFGDIRMSDVRDRILNGKWSA